MGGCDLSDDSSKQKPGCEHSNESKSFLKYEDLMKESPL